MSDSPQDDPVMRDALAAIVRKFGGCPALPKIEWIQRSTTKVSPPDGSETIPYAEHATYFPSPKLETSLSEIPEWSDPITPIHFRARRRVATFQTVVSWFYKPENNTLYVEYTQVEVPFTVWEA